MRTARWQFGACFVIGNVCAWIAPAAVSWTNDAPKRVGSDASIRERSRLRCSPFVRCQRKGCHERAGQVLFPSARALPDDGRRCPPVKTRPSRALMQQFCRKRVKDCQPLIPFLVHVPEFGHAQAQSPKDACKSTAHSIQQPRGPQRLLAERFRFVRLRSGCAPVLSPQPPSIKTQWRAPRHGSMTPPASKPVPVARPAGAQRIKKHGT